MKKYFKYYDLILILILIFHFNIFMQKKWKKITISYYDKLMNNILKKLVNELDIADSVKDAYFEDKLKNINENVTPNKQNMC